MRRSPPVRISRSGSGAKASASRCSIASASMPDVGPAGRQLLACGALGSLRDVPATAVVGADREIQPAVVRRALFRICDQLTQFGTERQGLADDPHADTEFDQLVDLALQGEHEQAHQGRHLVGGPPPVLRAECKQRQVLDAALAAGAERGTDRVDSPCMSRHPWLAARHRPAAVAVHDDRHVPRPRRLR